MQNNNNLAQVLDDGASYNDQEFYDGNQKDNQQSDHDSAGDWWNDPDIGKPEVDNIDGSDDSHDPNDIDLLEEDNTERRNTQRNRRGIAAGLPSANNGSELDKESWS